MKYDHLTLIERQGLYSIVQCDCGKVIRKVHYNLLKPTIFLKTCGCSLRKRRPEEEFREQMITYLRKVISSITDQKQALEKRLRAYL